MRWLHMRFHAPLASFGGTMIDGRGGTEPAPGRSMLTGLFANALGWTRKMRAEHQALQDRIVSGAVRDDDGLLKRMTDYQTAQLVYRERAWTTRGVPAERGGGKDTYDGAHQRWRDYHADLRMSVVLRLEPATGEPTVDALAAALDRPARTLFIGRKCCLPSGRIFFGWLEAPDARSALRAALRKSLPAGLRKEVPKGAEGLPAFWPESEGNTGACRTTGRVDERNWFSGLHGGERRICEGPISAEGDRT